MPISVRIESSLLASVCIESCCAEYYIVSVLKALCVACIACQRLGSAVPVTDLSALHPNFAVFAVVLSVLLQLQFLAVFLRLVSRSACDGSEYTWNILSGLTTTITTVVLTVCAVLLHLQL